jgi:hypothetical protein
MCRGFFNHVRYRRQDLALGPSDMLFRGQLLLDTILLKGRGYVYEDHVVVRVVRPDQLWDVCVGDGGGKPGSNAIEGCLLAVDQPCDYRTSLRGETRQGPGKRRFAFGEAARSGGGDP